MYCRPSYNVLFLFFLLSGALGRILFVKGAIQVLWYWYWYWYCIVTRISCRVAGIIVSSVRVNNSSFYEMLLAKLAS